MKVNIFDIQHGSFVDGPGIRTTVFFKGCNLKCKWCHNPESQSAKKELLFYRSKCNGCGTCKRVCPNGLNSCALCGKCADYCPGDARKLCGKNAEIDDVISEIVSDKGYYGKEGGVTFSGGECMLQIDALKELAAKCKERGIGTAVDTAGCVPWEYFLKTMPCTDIYLYDVKCVTETLHIEGTGQSNVLIKENLRRLSNSFGGKIIVRIPVIPGFNDSDAEMEKIAEFLRELKIRDVELLPYHEMGNDKYTALGRKCEVFSMPPKKRIDSLKSLFV